MLNQFIKALPIMNSPSTMQQQKSTANPRRVLEVPLPKLLMSRAPIMLNQNPEFAWWCLYQTQ